jgi:predicted MFS family arabinose efflux permease
MGLCLSAYHPAGTSLITHFIPASGRVFAVHGMAGSIGVAGSSVIAGALGAVAGWRWALALLALPGLALGLRVLALPKPAAHPQPTVRDGGHWRRLLLLLVAAGFMGMVYRGMTTFLPKLLSTTYTANVQTGAAVGGALTTAALLFGVIGMHTAGRISDSGRHPASVFLWGTVMQAPLLVAMAYAGGSALFALAVAVAFFHFFTQPVGNQLVAQLTPPHARGLGYGLYFFVAFGAGSTGAAVSGWVSDNLGLGHIFSVLAAALAPAALATLPLRSRHRPTPPPQPAVGEG